MGYRCGRQIAELASTIGRADATRPRAGPWLVSRDAGSFNDGGVQVGASQGGGPASMPSIVAGSPTPRGARLGAASVKEPASRDTSVLNPGCLAVERRTPRVV